MTNKLNEKAKKTFCPLAWNHAFVNQDGSFQVCCTSEEFDNNIRNDQGEHIFVGDGMSADQIMNTNYMKNLRKQMLNGEWPEPCKRCLITENMKGVSRREVEIVNYKTKIDEMLDSTKEDGSTSYRVTSADYRLGNLCNLQCRMCNPRSTKLWIKDWNDIKPENERFPQQVIDSYSKYDWIDSEDLVRDFEHKAPNLEHIHFAGGEPLLVPQMARILQKCIDSGNAKNIVITYNTNLTVLPKKVLELWKQFKGVKILASVDGIGPLNHYIRFPADWNQIDKNLHFIDEHHEEYNIQECILSVTVQALNIMHISEFYEYLNQFKFIVKAPNLVNLFHPHYFQTTVLPTQLKRIASLQLHQLEDKIRPRLEPHYHYLIDNLSGILTFMNSQDRSDTFKMFRDFQMKYDEKKKLNIMDYCPYFSHYWKLDP